eukprot:scaffold109730_cov30-Tisochrysis_lutea.AAC.3
MPTAMLRRNLGRTGGRRTSGPGASDPTYHVDSTGVTSWPGRASRMRAPAVVYRPGLPERHSS